MRRRLIAAAVASVIALASASAHAGMPHESTPTVSEQTQQCPTLADHHRLARRAYRYAARGGNYRAWPARPRLTKRLRDMRACQKRQHTGLYPDMRRDLLKQLVHWRFHRRIDRLTPYGEWAIPAWIVWRESRYDYRIWNGGCRGCGSTASGVYQILRSTWLANGGGRYASDAAYAPAWAQHIVASRLPMSAWR